MQKRSLSQEILEHLIVCGIPLVVHALFTPYGQSLRQALREVERLAAECPHDFSRRSPASVSVALSRLKQRGLVVHRGPRKKTIWRITSAGRRHFKSKHEFSGLRLPPEDGKIRLVLFDVPEKMRSERAWLRARLLFCDYSPLQKSVWTGVRALPDKLREELKHRKLDSYVRVVGLENDV